jgi:preprotein translocase subunit YajC
VTTGGIYGTVTEIEDGDTVLLEVAEDTEVRVSKTSIARILPAAADAADAESADAASTDADE